MFAPDGSWLAASTGTGDILIWPLEDGRIGAPRTLFHEDGYGFTSLETDDRGRFLVAHVADSEKGNGTLVQVSLPEGKVRTWQGAGGGLEVDGSGRWIASGLRRAAVLPTRVWDANTGKMWDLGDEETLVGFRRDGRLLTVREKKLYAWDMMSDERQVVLEDCPWKFVRLCPDRETLSFNGDDGSAFLLRPGESEPKRLPADLWQDSGFPSAADARCNLFVIGRLDGSVDVVRASSGEVHRLPLHDGVVVAAVDPREKWVASSGDDGLKLWPIPTGRPYLSLPREEFLRKLRSYTNLRAVKDDKQGTGYSIEASGIPDWQHPPQW